MFVVFCCCLCYVKWQWVTNNTNENTSVNIYGLFQFIVKGIQEHPYISETPEAESVYANISESSGKHGVEFTPYLFTYAWPWCFHFT